VALALIETYKGVDIYFNVDTRLFSFTYDTKEYTGYPTIELCHVQIDALVSGEVAPPPTWPWPFDMIQAWFEGLWDWVGSSARDAGSWLWDLIKPAFDTVSTWITDNVSWLWTSISSSFNAVSTWITEGITGLKDAVLAAVAGAGKAIGDFSTWLYNAVSGAFTWLSGVIWGWVDGALRWLTDSFKWLAGEIGEAASWITDSVRTMFDGALAEFGGWVGSVLEGMGRALGDALKGAWDWFVSNAGAALGAIGNWLNVNVIPPIWSALNWLWSWITGAVTGVFNTIKDMVKGISDQIKAGDPLPAFELLAVFTGAGLAATGILSVAGVKVLGSGIEVGELGKFLGDLFNPSMVTGVVIGTLLGVAIRTPLTQYYNSWIRPEIPDIGDATRMLWRGKIVEANLREIIAKHGYGSLYEEGYVALAKAIPGSGDLIRMVVREAFVPEMMVKAPTEFSEAMKLQGFDPIWSDRYWTAHFEPMALRQAYENLWRGYWTKSQFMYMLHIADIHPMWREDIYNVAFSPPTVRELGYGYDVGIYSVEDIIKYRRWGGLSEEDAEKAGIAMVAYRTEMERNALRTEAMNDFVAGLDTEEELRANLEALGGRPEVIELWVERAKFRAQRDLILDLKKTSVDQYVKGWVTEQQLDQDLIELDFTAERRTVILEEARTRRLKYKREEETARKKLMTPAKVEKARELGLIGDEEYLRRVMGTGITEEDAKLMLAIELTPKPVSPEEIERRRNTVLSRRRRCERRYERLIPRVQDQIDLTAGQLEDARITMTESLDIIDAQITIIDTEIPTATPERAEVLSGRRVVLVQRRELQAARYEARIRGLTEQHKNLIETKDLLTKQRDEELAEYDAELKLLEVAG